jgi:photosystem II stability/assembly factor-like uncharacterized protein
MKKRFNIWQLAFATLVVALVLLTGSVAALESASSGEALPEWQDFHLVSAEEGWILLDQHLYWTRDGGESWDEITPSTLEQSLIAAVFFLDRREGWLLLTNLDDSGAITYAMAQTSDGGKSWQVTPLSLFEAGDVNSLAGAVYLHFIDSQTGWLVIRRATSSNFSEGTLFKTTDGGGSWTQLTIPVGEPVYFVSSQIGWTAGGAAGDELYRTEDGGLTWLGQRPNRSLADDQKIFYQLPTFENAEEGVLPVVVTRSKKTVVEFYFSSDGGESWQLATSRQLDGERAASEHVPLSVFDSQHWIIVVPNSGRLLSISNRGESTTTISQDPMLAGISELDMVTPNVGWAKYISGSCSTIPKSPSSQGTTSCSLDPKLLRTEDGGKSWTTLSFPQADSPPSSDKGQAEGDLGDSSRASSGFGEQTATFIGQGFDKCEIATLSQLQNWSTNSPYRAVNLYIGGSSRNNS